MSKRPGTMSDDERALIGRAARQEPAHGVPQVPWHEETTGVHTDPQVFRAIKGLHEEIGGIHRELDANKRAAAQAHGALKQEVAALDAKIDDVRSELGAKLDGAVVSIATVSGQMSVLLGDRRSRSSSSETRATVKETLAEQVLAEQNAARAHARAVKLKLLGGVIAVLSSGAVLGAVVHWWVS